MQTEQPKTEGLAAVASSGLLGHSWFSHDPGDGFRIHTSEAEARETAEKALQLYRDDCAEGWDEEVALVCWGRVVQKVEEKWRKTKPPAEELDDEGYDNEGINWSVWDELVDYELSPNDQDHR